MTLWIAVGDETGHWDIVDQRFSGKSNGLSWLMGSAEAWDRALGLPLGSRTALEVFSSPISEHLPIPLKLDKPSPHYHLLDVWKARPMRPSDVPLETPQDDPVLERIRLDLRWLLEESGLGVLAAGGETATAGAAGLTASGDGMHARALAYARLMGMALPFLSAGDSLNLVAEPRSENAQADIHHRTREAGEKLSKPRTQEPYRDFLARLSEELARLATGCKRTLVAGSMTKPEDFHCISPHRLQGFLGKQRCCPLLQKNAKQAVAAMKGMADLAAALSPRESGGGTRFLVPEELSSHFHAMDYRELAHVAV